MSDSDLALAVAVALGLLYVYLSPGALGGLLGGATAPAPAVPTVPPGGTLAAIGNLFATAPGGGAVAPAQTVTVPTPGVTDVGSVDPSQLQIVSGVDVTQWPETSRITGVHLGSDGAIALSFDGQGSWPVVLLSAEGSDNIQYTVGIGFNFGGQWVAAPVIQMWQGRPDTGAAPAGLDLANQIAQNWLYGASGPLRGYLPTYGQPCVLFAANGNLRFGASDVPVAQRTNFVVVPFVPGDYDTSSQP